MNRIAVFVYHLQNEEESTIPNPPYAIIEFDDCVSGESITAFSQSAHVAEFLTPRRTLTLERSKKMYPDTKRIMIESEDGFAALKQELRDNGWTIPSGRIFPHNLKPWNPIEKLKWAQERRRQTADV